VAPQREQVLVTSRAQWRAWLAEHSATSPGIWLVTWKKGSGEPHVDYDAVVEEALAFGWVDSRPRSLDERRSQLLLTPRTRGSNWSRRNKERVQRLTAAGLMTDAGLAAVRAAQADGSWTALDGVEELAEPADLAARLDAVAEARRSWDAFPRSTRRAILEWLLAARTRGTRDRRLTEVVERAARGERANQWRQPGTARSG
jgi:uncharacterized protein YdeI (YjbR/CyaY-like superfamily)